MITETTKCYTWDTLNLRFVDVDWTWEECQLIREAEKIISGALPQPFVEDVLGKWEQEKKKKFIKIVCRVRGYDEIKTQKLVKENINIKIEDIKLVVESTKHINIEILNIK